MEEKFDNACESFPDILPEVDMDPTGAELRLGRPEICQGNGEDPQFEICCENCDWYLACFPEAL